MTRWFPGLHDVVASGAAAPQVDAIEEECI